MVLELYQADRLSATDPPPHNMTGETTGWLGQKGYGLRAIPGGPIVGNRPAAPQHDWRNHWMARPERPPTPNSSPARPPLPPVPTHRGDVGRTTSWCQRPTTHTQQQPGATAIAACAHPPGRRRAHHVVVPAALALVVRAVSAAWAGLGGAGGAAGQLFSAGGAAGGGTGGKGGVGGVGWPRRGRWCRGPALQRRRRGGCQPSPG